MNCSLTLKQIKYYSGATDNEKIRLDKKMLESEDFYSKTYGSTKIQSIMNMAQKLDQDCLEAIENDSGDSIDKFSQMVAEQFAIDYLSKKSIDACWIDKIYFDFDYEEDE